jgi:uncharacterized iron-regulated membrane protein
MLRKNIYQLHRTLSLIIALPVLLWAVSGFMHPLMTNIKPAIAQAFIAPKPIDTGKISMGIGEVLAQHEIKHYHRFRLISIDANWFYQIQINPTSKPLYFSTTNGKGLVNGDELYAQYLGGKFLMGEKGSDTSSSVVTNTLTDQESSDCCASATACVKNVINKSPIKQVDYIQSFDQEYKEINRLLPAYKISYQRDDGIRLYVETTSDRLAYAVDDKRASFDYIFFLLHNWGWMDFAGDFKYILMTIILGIAILSTLMGLYILRITKSVKKIDNPALKARYRHRKFSVFAFFFTLLFAFSGAFHALEKVNKQNTNGIIESQRLDNNDLSPDIAALKQLIPLPVTNISSVQIGDQFYWQVFALSKKKEEDKNKSKDFRKQGAKPLSVFYIHAKTGQLLKNGDQQYATYLAMQYSGFSEQDIKEQSYVTKFEGEYGFVNKRLPVWKIKFNKNDNIRYYIETSTGYLSTTVKNSDLWEGLSFAYLHKHHFMDWSGKIGRDISTMFWSMVQIILIATGLILWARRKIQQ